MTYENNILYVDIEKLDHHMILYNNTPPRIRLFLGILRDDEFEVTVESIKLLPDEQQLPIRNYIKTIFNI